MVYGRVTTPDIVDEELRRLYEEYGKGRIPPHILELAARVEEACQPSGEVAELDDDEASSDGHGE